MTKINVDSKSLVEAIQWATKSFDGKNDKAFVVLSVSEDGVGSLSHFNQTSYMKTDFTVLTSEIEETLELALDGRYLQRLAGAIDSSGNSELEYSKKLLTLKSKAGKFTLPTFNSKVPKTPEYSVLGEVNDVEYFDAIQRLAKLCDPAAASLFPTLGTVDIKANVETKRVALMATDRYALGEIVIDFDPSPEADAFFENNADLLMPVESAMLISPSKGAVTAVELVFSEDSGDKFGYKFADGRIALFSMKDAKPLPYESTKNGALERIENKITVTTKELQKALSTISSLAWDESDIYLKITDTEFVVHDSSKSNSLEVSTENVDVTGEHTVKFVRSVINEAFSPISTEKFNLKFKDEKNAFVLEPVLDTGKVSDRVFVLAAPTM